MSPRWITSPAPAGWTGREGRKKAGLPDGGPQSVITNMATMGFDDVTKEMYLTGFFPGITPRRILDNMGFDIDVSRATEVAPPTDFELKILREKCDPQRLILG